VTWTHLRKRQLVAAPKERRRICQQRLQLLHRARDGRLLGLDRLLRRLGAPEHLGQVAVELGREGVREEGDAGAAQRTAGLVGGRHEVRGDRVGEQVGDDAGLGDDLLVLADLDGRHEAARVDLEVPGLAGLGEVDDDLVVGELELVERDVCAVRPCGLSVAMDSASLGCQSAFGGGIDADVQGHAWLV
jgi:hypothetical protein